MKIDSISVKKTNEIFNRLCSALKLSTEDRVQWMSDAGYPVTKSKVTNWGGRGKNYTEMPSEALSVFLEKVKINANSALIRVIAAFIKDVGLENINDDQLNALSELVKINNREYGYTPKNLRHECLMAGSRAKFAKKHNIPDLTLDKWCRQLDDPNHRDMPAIKWLEIISSK